MRSVLLPERAKASFPPRVLRAWMILGLMTCALLSMAHSAQAQGIDRSSVAGEGTLTRGSDADQPYNLMLGPVALRAAASDTIGFNDNINIAEHGRQADVIDQTAVDFAANWQITEENSLTFGLGIGYQAYLEHSGDSGLIISPSNSSGTQFNMIVGNVKLDFHDFFSLQQNPIDVGQLSNIAQFPVFQNDAGLKVSWDFNEDISLSAGYDHTNEWYLDHAFEYLNSQSDTITPTLTYYVSKTIQTGINTSFTSMRYNQNIMNDSTSFTAGPFVTSQLSEYLSVSAQVGAESSNYGTSGSVGDTENSLTSWYGSLGVNHRINDVLTESFTAGQEYLPGITSNFTQRVYANYSPTWQATPFINVAGNLWYENLDDSQAAFREESNRFGTGVNIGWAATDHATLSLGYQYVLKAADIASLGYYQNQVNLAFRYQF